MAPQYCGARLNGLCQLLLDTTELALEPADVFAKALLHCRSSHQRAVLLRDQHLDELAPAGQDSLQGRLLRIR